MKVTSTQLVCDMFERRKFNRRNDISMSMISEAYNFAGVNNISSVSARLPGPLCDMCARDNLGCDDICGCKTFLATAPFLVVIIFLRPTTFVAGTTFLDLFFIYLNTQSLPAGDDGAVFRIQVILILARLVVLFEPR